MTELDLDVILNKLKDKKYISVSLIQKELGVGFNKANRIFNELKDNDYLVKTSNERYVFKDELKEKKGLPSVKLIFLDVDGVLNSNTTKDRCANYIGIDDKKVELLKELVNQTNAKIILTSTWKEYWYKEARLKSNQDYLATYLDNKLEKQGLKISAKACDVSTLNRGYEILEYLDILRFREINVSNFVILDDEMFDYKERKLTKYLVKTSFKKGGFTIKHLLKAIEILNK